MKRAIIILYFLVIIIIGWLSYACYCEFRFDPNSSAGIIVSTLGILVTFLVAWQIWQTMASREEIRRAERTSRKCEELSKNLELVKTLPEAYFFYSLGHSEHNRGAYELSFQYLVYACQSFFDNSIPYEKYTTVALNLMKDCIVRMGKDKVKSLSAHITAIDRMINQSKNLSVLASEAERMLTEIKDLITA